MIRILVAAVVALALLPAAASAHPLGNFSLNKVSQVSGTLIMNTIQIRPYC